MNYSLIFALVFAALFGASVVSTLVGYALGTSSWRKDAFWGVVALVWSVVFALYV